jgi:hypothetical protein
MLAPYVRPGGEESATNQVLPTIALQMIPAPRLATGVISRMPARKVTSGLLILVTVLQHTPEFDSVLHWLVEIGVRFGGGNPPSPAPLDTRTAEAATLLVAARAATKEMRDLENIIVETRWRLW